MLFCLPLLFSTRTYDNFSLHKAVFFHACLSVVVILAAFRSLLEKSRLKSENTFNPLFFPLFCLLCASTLSFLCSQNTNVSFLGNYQRFDGYYHFIHLILFYFVLLYFFPRTKADHFVLIILCSSFFVSVYALCQHFGFDSFSWLSIDRRSISTFGHANTLAAYLSMVFPFAFSEYLHPVVLTRSQRSKAVSFVLCAVLYGAVLTTFSRAGLLSLLCGGCVVLIVHGWKKCAQNFFKLLIFFLFVIAATLYFQSESQRRILPVTLNERFLSAANFQESSVHERFLIWETCLKIIKVYPFTGTGFESLVNIFPEYKSKELVKLGAFYIADKAHNEYLHVAATTGFFGFFSYVWFVVCLLMTARHISGKFRHDDAARFTLSNMFYSSLIAYLVNNFFGFSSITTQVYFIFIAAYFSYCYMNEPAAATLQPQPDYKFQTKNELAAVMVCALMLSNILWNVSLWLADFYYKKAVETMPDNDRAASVPDLERAVSFNPLEAVYQRELANVYASFYGKGEKLLYFKKAEDLYVRILQQNRRDIEALYTLGCLYEARARATKSGADFVRAVYSLKEAHRYYPNYPLYVMELGELYYKWAHIANNKAKLSVAHAYLKEAYAMSPEDYDALFLDMKIYYEQGNLSQAMGILQNITGRLPQRSDPYVWMGNIYQEKHQFEKAVLSYKNALVRNPSFPAGIYCEMAKAYMNTGDLSQAESYAEKALALQKNYGVAKKLISEIHQKQKP